MSLAMSRTRSSTGTTDNWCYLPLLAFLRFDRESEQYLCAALLRHGKAVAVPRRSAPTECDRPGPESVIGLEPESVIDLEPEYAN